jgi:hypothetical protein
MSNTIDRSKLAKTLGMLGSAHDGEALNAGRAAVRMLRDCGVSWHELLDPGASSSRDAEKLRAAQAEIERLKRQLAANSRDRSNQHPKKPTCAWCRKRFTPEKTGRPPKFCSDSCRQSSYQKRTKDWRAMAEEEALAQAKEQQFRRQHTSRIRREIISELVQHGFVPITSPEHIDMYIAGRSTWRSPKIVDELETHFRETGNQPGLDAIKDWRRNRGK